MNDDIFSLPQLIGYIGLAIYVAGYGFRDDNRMKIAFSLSNLFWIVHYHLIHADTAAVTTALITLRNLFALNSEAFSKARRLGTAWVFTALLIATGALTWAGPVSLIPVTTCIVITFAMIYLKGVQLRQVLLLSDLAWMAHAVIVRSYGGFVYALSAVAMNIVTMRKMRANEPG